MLLHVRLVVALSIVIATSCAVSAADQQCLSKDELANVARMASTMGVGGALNRCGRCLGDRYQPAVKAYEATGMLVEFRRAEASIQKARPNFEYADDLVRMAARNYAMDMAADCAACEKLANTIEGLSTDGTRASFYEAATAKVTEMPSFRACPQE